MISNKKELWWECQCGNHCLRGYSLADRPATCHPKCSGADWKLMYYQDSYQVGKDNWTHPDGEVFTNRNK